MKLSFPFSLAPLILLLTLLKSYELSAAGGRPLKKSLTAIEASMAVKVRSCSMERRSSEIDSILQLALKMKEISCPLFHDWDHRLFLTTNERNSAETLKFMTKEGRHEKGNTILGVSGFFSLDLAASLPAGKIKNIIIMDRSESLKRFFVRFQGLMKAASSRVAFIKALKEDLRVHSEEYFPHFPLGDDPKREAEKEAQSYIEKLELLLPVKEGSHAPKERERSVEEMDSGDLDFLETVSVEDDEESEEEDDKNLFWLRSDESFGKIKDIVEREGLVFVGLDLTEETEVKKLADMIKEGPGMELHTVYISNVQEYVESNEATFNGLLKAMEHLQQVAGEGTLLINNRPRKNGRCSSQALKQQVHSRFKSTPVTDMVKRFPLSLSATMSKK